jgi:hypothetical protein
VYDPAIHHLRNAGEIAEACIVAEAAMQKNSRVRNVEERDAIKLLRDQCIHPMVNVNHSAPMGCDNNIYNSGADSLHAYECGIFKNEVLWTVDIVDNISKIDKRFTHNKGLLDSRISSFPLVPEMPHISWVPFKKGLTYLSKNKSSQEKSRTTGSGGRFRSSEYVPALMQLYFAVSPSMYEYI